MPNQPKPNIPNTTGRRSASGQEDARPTSAVRTPRSQPRTPEPLTPFPRNAPEEAPAPRLVARPYTESAPRSAESPRLHNERQVAQPYQRPSQNDHRVQMRRFVDDSPVGWFHLTAHRIALFIHPVFTATVFLINLALQITWEIVQIVASLLPIDAQRRVRRLGSPTLRQDSPVTVIVFAALLLFTIGGLSRPLLLPTSDPRSFSSTERPLLLRISDPTRALNLFQNAVDTVKAAITPDQSPAAPEQAFVGQRTAGDHNIQGAPSISPAQIDSILASYDSPATGTGQAWFDLGAKYNIDPAYAVAFFIHESSAGTNPAWAGWKDYGSRASTHNVGNIICAGYPTCYGRFRDYPSWEAGIDDWYRLISVEYIQGRGTMTIAQIIPIYAPSFENNVDAYVGAVETLVDTWRTQGVP